MEDYQLVYEELQMLFEGVSQYELDMSLIQQLFEEAPLENLCNNGICAVTHIHNMTREGKYLLYHSLNVGILAGLMGRWLRWPPERRHRLTIAGLFHDIGKLWIDQAILDKPGKLTDEEFTQIKSHPRTGYEFLCQTSLYDEKEILEGVLQHHERNDGTGYPDQLSQPDISDFGRILGILDVYDAMAADRSYAKRSSPFDIFEIIAEDIKQGRLDAEYGVTFVRYICHAMNGNWVLLTTGEKAKIVYIDESRVNTLPVVQTENGDFIDLAQDNTVQVKMLLTYKEQQE
jgi:HD-GYP domain-containing protein (c-di-GMP phosphodiesterase class II)